MAWPLHANPALTSVPGYGASKIGSAIELHPGSISTKTRPRTTKKARPTTERIEKSKRPSNGIATRKAQHSRQLLIGLGLRPTRNGERTTTSRFLESALTSGPTWRFAGYCTDCYALPEQARVLDLQKFLAIAPRCLGAALSFSSAPECHGPIMANGILIIGYQCQCSSLVARPGLTSSMHLVTYDRCGLRIT